MIGLFFSFPVLADQHPQKNVLLILAHPDDEAYIRSFIARWVENDVRVSALYLTVGEGGRDARWTDFKPGDQSRKEELALTRGKEMAATDNPSTPSGNGSFSGACF